MVKYYIVTLLALVVFTASFADDNKKKLSMNGTDPTEVRDRLDFVVGEAQFTSSRNLFGFKVKGYKMIVPWLSVGIRVPLLYSDADYENKFSMGDVNVGLLTSFYSHQHHSGFSRYAFGLKYYLNTGDPFIGTGVGQQYLAPRLTAIFLTREGDAFIAPTIEYFYSINNDPDYLKINKLDIKVEGTLNFNDYWITITPEIKFDFEGVYATTYYIGSYIGKMVNKNWGASVDFIYRFAGEPDFNYLGRLNIRYLL